MHRGLLLILLIVLPVTLAAEETVLASVESTRLAPASTRLAPDQSPRPAPRRLRDPRMRWPAGTREAALWTQVMLSALEKGHARPLIETVPRDIAQWCPAYPDNPAPARAAFWAGFASTLAKYESTYRPQAVGGGGLWHGLLQILPGTAHFNKCTATTGPALRNGAANLSCALRIMARTVPRDQAISLKDSRWRGVAADWGPMRSEPKRRDMARWLSQQSYCQPIQSTRPRLRPASWPPTV